MGFDHLRRLGSALHDIGIDRSLCQEFDSLQFSGFFLENADKFRTDNLSFLLRIGNTGQLAKETIDSVHVD